MTSAFEITRATRVDLPALLALVRDYHRFERVELDDARRVRALGPLLDADGPGQIWLLHIAGEAVGYLAVCFGYSIEFAGRDAFVDEFFLAEPVRGRGLGRKLLEHALEATGGQGVGALHLEVARGNDRARGLYEAFGFEARTDFHLMSRSFDEA